MEQEEKKNWRKLKGGIIRRKREMEEDKGKEKNKKTNLMPFMPCLYVMTFCQKGVKSPTRGNG
jgi:hypothetical protein